MHFFGEWLRKASFRRQLVFAVALGVLCTVLLSALGSSWQGSHQIRATLREQGERVAENLARQSKLALLYDSGANVRSALDLALGFPDVMRAEVFRRDGRLLTVLEKRGAPGVLPVFVPDPGLRAVVVESENDRAWHIVAPVIAEGFDSPFEITESREELLGYVRVVQSKATLARMRADVVAANLAIALAASLVFLAAIRVLSARLTRPLTQLSEAMARAERGEPQARAAVEGPRDIAGMAHAFNRMMSVLEEREHDLRKARDEALKFARLKADFAAMMSHEIRTPLNGVIGTLDMLMASQLPSQQRQYVEIAWDSARYLLDLINDILDFSRLEAGKLALDKTSFDVRQLIEDVIQLLAPQAHRKGLELGYMAAAEVPQRARADPRRIRQVLINLIGNAIKFTDEGEIAVHVMLAPDSDEHTVLRFEVRDSGIGVAPEAQARIFDSFTQGDPSSTRRHTGSGLGLAICKQLVGVMGGVIGVDSGAESGVAQGSRFWFTLPVEVDAATVPNESSAASAPQRPALERHARARGVRALVVDESSIVCHFLKQSLEAWQYGCDIAHGADEALEELLQAAAAGRRFDVAIVDAALLDLDDSALLRRIRAHAAIAATRVIVMNRYGSSRPAGSGSAADAYLSKPLTLDRVLERIAAVTGADVPHVVLPPPPVERGKRLYRVLIVEDVRTNQTIARAMLGMLGCQGEIAANGREAMRLFEQKTWDLVLMDCAMPEMDGYEVTALLRALEDERGLHTPIIAMTANTQPADIEKCLAAGMDDHLPKPLTLGSLAAKLQRWVARHAFEVQQLPAEAARSDPAARAGASEHPLDPVVLRNLREALGNVLQPMIRPFLEDLPDYLEQIRAAITAGDAERMRRAAHSVKGAASNIGAAALATAAKEIEDRAASGRLAGLDASHARLAAEAVRVRDALSSESSHESPAAPQAADDAALVLVVDDDRSTRSALRFALQAGGFRVEEATDGAQALALVERTRPDVVLIDALMPVMDGFTACARLQEMPAGKDIPILMITALEDNRSIERAFAAGASDYISKPLHLAVVNQRVKRLVEATRAERHVRHLAYYDALTGLPNRALFTDYLYQAIGRAHARTGTLAVLFLDLDRFKLVNDTLGHEVGDHLLKAVTHRLQACVRAGDCVARLGGDEFTLVLEDLPTGAATAAAQKICRALAAPFDIDGHDIFVAASIGIALYPNDGLDAGTLLRRADTAMYRAKKEAHGFKSYEAGMDTALSAQLRLDGALRHALENDEFVVHYQPIAETASGRTTGVEALLRWPQPGRGVVTPGQFIALAEETGLIVPIGESVLRAACRQAARWRAAGADHLRVSVNVSGTQLNRGRFAETVAAVLSETGLPAQSLTLEITESVIMEHARETVAVLEQLKDIGVTLAIDDFGTGYSSLAYLKRFPVHQLKIDRAFTSDMTENLDDASIINGMIALAHSLRLKVVAEGVETRQQQELLARLRCDYIQGFYLSEPLPAELFERRILPVLAPDNVFARRRRG